MDCRFAFLCAEANRHDGQVDAVDIGVEGALAERLPVLIPLTFVVSVSYSRFEAGLKSLVIGCMGEDGDPVVHPTEASMDFLAPEAGIDGTRTFVFEMPDATFPAYGRYTFYLTVDGHQMARASFAVSAPSN